MDETISATDYRLSPFGDFLGIEHIASDDTGAVCRMKLSSNHFNAGGRVHGGALSSLADTAAGLVVRANRPEHSVSATTDLSIAYIRSPLNFCVSAKATLLHAGKRLHRVEIIIVDDDTTDFDRARLVARATATFIINKTID
jgi:acyl-CoA thioesterase